MRAREVTDKGARREDAGRSQFLRGRCLPYGQGITFWPIRSVISQAAGLSAEESPEAAREKIRSLVAEAPDANLIVEPDSSGCRPT